MIMSSQGKKITDIAAALGRSCSTISRELRRRLLTDYRASLAQASYLKHRQKYKAVPKLQQSAYRHLVQTKVLEEKWSPEQLGHRLKWEGADLSISYNTIYRAIHQGWFDVGERKASRKLRHKGKTRQNKNHHEKRGKIVISHSLDVRALGSGYSLRDIGRRLFSDTDRAKKPFLTC